MLTNKEVIEFKGSNAELCALCGKTPNEDSPPHWANFTARALRERAALAMTNGNGEQEFQSGRAKKSSKVTQSPSATEVLPAPLLAILPAIAMKVSMPDVKAFIAENSIPATMNYDAQLPLVVIEVLAFFGLDNEDNRSLLLKYSAVKTYRDVLFENVIESINVLQDSIKDMEVHSLERLKVALIKFSMNLDSVIDDYGNII